MGLFNDMLKGDESLFLDTMPLDVDYIPPIIKYRENEQQQIAKCIQPLLKDRSGKNVLINGSPGIGKTVAVKGVLEQLHQETGEITTLYVNCWKKDTSYKIALDLCDQLGFKFVQHRDTSDLFKEVARILNKKKAVIVLDEADMLSDEQALYTLMEEIYKKSLIIVTNDSSWFSKLDGRVRSRLLPEVINFRPYNAEEIKGILCERVKYAFVPQVFTDDAFDVVVEKTTSLEDVRVGLRLLREAGEKAEDKASKRVLLKHVNDVVNTFDAVKKKDQSLLTESEEQFLTLIKQQNGKTTKQIFEVYQENGGEKSYSTFHRTLKHLEKGGFLALKDVVKGQRGRSTVVEFNEEVKTLQDF